MGKVALVAFLAAVGLLAVASLAPRERQLSDDERRICARYAATADAASAPAYCD